MFVCAFAEDESDIAGEQFAGKGAGVEGCEESGEDEAVVGCWAELVDFNGFGGVQELFGWEGTQTGEFLVCRECNWDLQSGEKLVELELCLARAFWLDCWRVGEDACLADDNLVVWLTKIVG